MVFLWGASPPIAKAAQTLWSKKAFYYVNVPESKQQLLETPVKENGGHDDASDESKENNCPWKNAALSPHHTESAVEGLLTITLLLHYLDPGKV